MQETVWWLPSEGRFWVQWHRDHAADAAFIAERLDAINVTNAHVVVDEKTGIEVIQIGSRDYNTAFGKSDA